jgi:hypothetical protein
MSEVIILLMVGALWGTPFVLVGGIRRMPKALGGGVLFW